MKPFLRLFPSYRRLELENVRLRAETAEWQRFVPPGHFYSPLPSAAEVAEAFARGGFGPPFPGIDLREEHQFALLQRIVELYPTQPFPEQPTPGRRFHLDNPIYSHFDAIVLQGMLRLLRPRRIVEVGSGFSSAAMLDLNDLVFDGSVQHTFIDPDMSRLRPLLRPGDLDRVRLHECRVQDVPIETFDVLESGDVLFIDSSHVSKIGSDVNRLYFEVLPRLRPGVHIHIHDIAANLEYPRQWYDEGRAWNEQYVLRAFLMFNRTFAIELLSPLMFATHHAFVCERMPLCARGYGGQIWLQRVA